MGAGKNTYIEGLDSDTSEAKIKASKLRECVDLKVFTTDGKTTVGLSSVKGNLKMLELPSIYIRDRKDGVHKSTTLPAGHTVLLTEEVLPVNHRGKIVISTSRTEAGMNNSNMLQYSYYANRDTSKIFPRFTDGYNQNICGWTTVRDDLILFSTTNTSEINDHSNDIFVIWRIRYKDDLSYTIQMMYVGNTPHTTKHMIEAISRHENNTIEKVYWTDGNVTAKHFNLSGTSPHDIYNAELEFTPPTNLYAPRFNKWIEAETTFKGMVQYAYSLYNRSGAESRMSPLSLPTYLKDKQPNISFWADLSFKNAKIYRIYYESHTSVPVVTLIMDRPYDPYTNNYITFNDTGQILEQISLTEFALTGGNPKIIETLTEKDNRLIIGNIKESQFDPTWDSRAYRFNNNGLGELFKFNGDPLTRFGFTKERTVSVGNYPGLTNGEESLDCFQLSNLDPTTSSVFPYNLDPSINEKFQVDGSTVGGEGPNIKYSFGADDSLKDTTRTAFHSSNKDTNDRFGIKKFDVRAGYKRMEIYRFGIQFINEYGQASFVNWIADIKFPSFDMDDGTVVKTPHLNVEIKNFPIGYNNLWSWRILRAKRGESDRTIITQGIHQQWHKPVFGGDSDTVIPESFGGLNSPPMKVPYFMATGSNYNDEAEKITATNTINSLINNEMNYITPIISEAVDGDYFHCIGKVTQIEPIFDYTTYEKVLVEFLNVKVTKQVTFSDVGTTRYIPEDLQVMLPNKRYQFKSNNKYNACRNTMWGESYYGKGTPTYTSGGSQTTTGTIGATNLVAQGGKCIGWGSSGHPLGNDFNDQHSPILDFRRRSRNQYGGFRHDQRAKTVYIPCSEPTRGTNNKILGGDTYTALTRILKNSWFHAFDGADTTNNRTNTGNVTTGNEIHATKSVLEIVLETTIPPGLEGSDVDNTFQTIHPSELHDVTSNEFYDFDHVYRKEQDFPTFVSKPINFNEVSNFDFLVRASEPKFNNELIDSFLRYRTNLFMELDPKYGRINRLINHNDEVMSFQDTGIAHIVINPRVQTSSLDGQAIQLGLGNVLHDKKYISTKSGTKSKFSVFDSKKSIYFYDTLQNKIKTVTGDLDISDLKGIHGKLSLIHFPDEYSINEHITGGVGVYGIFDPEHSEALFSFKAAGIQAPMVLAFNEKSQVFTHSYGYSPQLLINDSKNLLSTGGADRPNDLWIHGRGNTSKYYDTTPIESYFHVVVNGSTELSKIFDNWAFNMEAYDASGNDLPNVHPKACRVYNDYQDSGIVPFVNRGNIRRLQRTWEANIPRQQSSRLTMRGPWINIIFYFDNNNDYTYVMHDLHTKYRP
jgi:hypothetical protein